MEVQDIRTIPENILSKAWTAINLRCLFGTWPTDTLIGLYDEWDLHLLTDDDGKSAVIYPVVDGNTITDDWAVLYREN